MSEQTSEETESSYYKELSEDDKVRYKEKMRMLEMHTDPYLLPTDRWSTDRKVWPTVEFPDICVYLLNSPSPYTKESLKEFKIIEVAGFVEEVLVTKISGNTLLMTAKVMCDSVLMNFVYEHPG